LSDESVVTELGSFLNYKVDTESEAGEPIAKRFGVRGLPTLLFLNPDGTVRDALVGYRPPERFLEELKRIREDRDTIADLERRVQAHPDDLELRYKLIVRLRGVDEKKAEAHVAEIRKRDPEGRSLPARRLRLGDLLAKLPRDVNLDTSELVAFLAGEKDPELLFQGWSNIFYARGVKLRLAQDDDARKEAFAALAVAAREAWDVVPERSVASFGNSVAWTFWENRELCGKDDTLWALEVARKASAAAPDNVNILDTLACCLYAAGQREEALKLVRKCIEMDPENEEWQKRWDELSKVKL